MDQPSRRAKILCTIGPASSSPESLRALMDAGLDGARLNFSHGSHEQHQETYDRLRSAAKELDRPLCILGDLQGPKIRVGQMPEEGLKLVRQQTLTLTVDPACEGYDGERVRVDYPRLADEANPGDRILIDDGELELVIEHIEGPDIHTRVVLDGVLKSRKGVNLPESDLSIPSMTDKDRIDLKYALDMGVDVIALSFVRAVKDLELCRTLMREHGRVVPLIAKVEKPEAVQNLDDIVACADGVMVARGDLGVEMGPEEVPTIQKRLISACNNAGKLVITATQMLDSMIRNPRPTRAEASDVANAILDGSDVLMLSGETATGRYPLRSVRTMDRIIRNAEQSERFKSPPPKRLHLNHRANAIARAATVAGESLSEARGIVCYTGSGGTARLMSSYRPDLPIYAFTPERSTYNSLALYWGVVPVSFAPSTDDGEHIFEDLDRAVLKHEIVSKGEMVIIAMGWPIKARSSVNLLKIHAIGEALEQGGKS